MITLQVVEHPTDVHRPGVAGRGVVEFRQGHPPMEIPIATTIMPGQCFVIEGCEEGLHCGACGRVLALVPLGIMGNLYLRCPDCGAYNESDDFDREASAAFVEKSRDESELGTREKRSRLPWRRS